MEILLLFPFANDKILKTEQILACKYMWSCLMMLEIRFGKQIKYRLMEILLFFSFANVEDCKLIKI